MAPNFKSRSDRVAHRGKFLALHFEKKMNYAQIAEAEGIGKIRVGQLVREGKRFLEQGQLEIRGGKICMPNGKEVL